MSSVNDMLTELNDHGFADEGTPRKLAMLQDSIWELEALEPWPFLEVALLLNFDGDTGTPVNAPSDFRAAMRMKHLVQGRRVKYVSIDDFEDIVGADYLRSGEPTMYYFEGSELKVWPVPTPSTGSVKFRYLKFSAEITADTTEAEILIPKYYHRVIVLSALIKLYTMEDDIELAAGFEQQLNERLMKMRASIWQRQFDSMEYVHSVDPEEWDYETV